MCARTGVLGDQPAATPLSNTNREGGSPSLPIAPAHVPVRAAVEDTCMSADGVDRHRPRSGGARDLYDFNHLAGRGFVPLCLSPCARQGTSRLRCGDICRMRAAPAVRGSAAREGRAELPDGRGQRCLCGGFVIGDWGSHRLGCRKTTSATAWHGMVCHLMACCRCRSRLCWLHRRPVDERRR